MYVVTEGDVGCTVYGQVFVFYHSSIHSLPHSHGSLMIAGQVRDELPDVYTFTGKIFPVVPPSLVKFPHCLTHHFVELD